MELPVHIKEDALERYIVRKASTEEMNSIGEHVQVCDECRTRISQLEKFISSLRAASHLM